ncbi:hypothetical protein KY290_007880 [Solanum tuberosum]|uniref:Uncharacterized protein n=1 Tax=Solanum tuberosum TaxID=4113 RepID=A0ABQ7W6Z4_SOLTU|nr:hypothetical protein KY290_007880 [Solanum tuberosum]
MAKIDNYEDSSAQATDDVESSVEKLTVEMKRVVEIAEILEMRMMIPCPCHFVQEKSLKKINLKKQSEVYNEKGNASYTLYGFPWAFLVWIYETFPHLGKYAKKSLDSPLPIPRLLRWHTTKSDNIVNGDSFNYKGRSTKIVHPYLIPNVR